jgi:putative ABC transport system ATP-binding protein
MGAIAAGRALIELRGVTKVYGSDGGRFEALRGVSLELRSGEFAAIVGRSGSGKSTLLNILTGIDSPSSGEVYVGGTAIHRLGQEELARWRGRSAGVVFQFFQLLPSLTVVENVMLPMDFLGQLPVRVRELRARELLDKVGIADQGDKLPAELSGGQQQRAAIARSLANDPPVIFADEPTGNLDSGTAEEVMRYFSLLAASGKTIVMATHEKDVDRWFTRKILLADGLVAAPDAAGAEASDA